MKEFSNTKISKLDFQLIKKGDIIEFEGPLLSHFTDEMGGDYFMKWVDKDSESNRWLLFYISKIDLNDYFLKTKTLRTLIKSSNEIVYLIDIDNNIDFNKIQVISKDAIPEKYLPKESSNFNEKISTDYSKILKKDTLEAFLDINTKSIKKKLKQAERHSDDIDFMNILDKRNISTSIMQVAIIKATERPIRILMDYYKNESLTKVIHLQPAAYANQMNYINYFRSLNRSLKIFSHKTTRTHVKNVSGRNKKIVLDTFEILLDNADHVVKIAPEKYSKAFEHWKQEIGNIEDIGHLIK